MYTKSQKRVPPRKIPCFDSKMIHFLLQHLRGWRTNSSSSLPYHGNCRYEWAEMMPQTTSSRMLGIFPRPPHHCPDAHPVHKWRHLPMIQSGHASWLENNHEMGYENIRDLHVSIMMIIIFFFTDSPKKYHWCRHLPL